MRGEGFNHRAGDFVGQHGNKADGAGALFQAAIDGSVFQEGGFQGAKCPFHLGQVGIAVI